MAERLLQKIVKENEKSSKNIFKKQKNRQFFTYHQNNRISSTTTICSRRVTANFSSAVLVFPIPLLPLLLIILVSQIELTSGIKCDFTEPCDWTFDPPENGFRTILGKQKHYLSDKANIPKELSSDVTCYDHRCMNQGHYAYMDQSGPEMKEGMIVSPVYQYTGQNCELSFDYRLMGHADTEIFVTTERVWRHLETGQVTFRKPIYIKQIKSTQSYVARWTSVSIRLPSLQEQRIRIQAALTSTDDYILPGTAAAGAANNSKTHSDSGITNDKAIIITTTTRTTSSSAFDRTAQVMIDNITLHNCDEKLFHPNKCKYDKSNKYMCPETKVCIDLDQICDMHNDCYFGEDEDPDIHYCDEVPKGARCDFETPGVFCDGWTIKPSKNVTWERVNAMDMRKRISGIGRSEVNRDHTFRNSSGHFAHIDHGSSKSKMKSVNAMSPWFPRMSPELRDPSSPLFQACRVTFYVCPHHTSISSMVRLHIHQPGRKNKKELWKPTELSQHIGVASKHFCEWKRISKIIPFQQTDYRLIFNQNLLFPAKFSFDDLSLTPQCFMGNSSTNIIPQVYSFSTCNATGPTGPSQLRCERAYNETAIKVDAEPLRTTAEKTWKGYQRWTVPKTAEYRIVASGASGGILPSMKGAGIVKNYGAMLDVKVNLTVGENLDIIVGQQGESVCWKYKDEVFRLGENHPQIKILARICNPADVDDTNNDETGDTSTTAISLLTESNKDSDVGGSTSLKELANLPGTGGGGATWVVRGLVQAGNKYRPLLVAAGGGGLFHAGNSESAGGRVNLKGWARAALAKAALTNENEREMMMSAMSIPVIRPSQGHTVADVMTKAGGGGGYRCGAAIDQNTNDGQRTTNDESSSRSLTNDAVKCPPSNLAAGHPFSLSARGGRCNDAFDMWSFSGGFGGGGASCGSGGGGGGGFQGGDAGNLTNGQGGLSWWDMKVARLADNAENSNLGNGRLLIYPCRLECPDGAICRFNEKNMEICMCEMHNKVLKDLTTDKCPVPPTPNQAIRGQNGGYQHDILLAMVIAFSFLVFAILVIVCFVVYYYKCGHGMPKTAVGKYGPRPFPTNTQQSFQMHAFPTNTITNYNYGLPMAQPNFNEFSPVTIDRNFITLIKGLGQGAFGEVYEGLYSEPNQSTDRHSLPIAVKTLPEFATDQAHADFQMEAWIMNKFNHPNIVRFMGVSFDKMPRFIVLELLAGGDLKTFLRENRPTANRVTKNLKMTDLISMAIDVARGCQYLEENHFIHRDIAARNCLLTTKEADRVVKIADFGMARDIYRNDYYKKGGKAMLPVRWMPPEAFLDGIFTSKTDVWSFGILLWEIFSMGYVPYFGRQNNEVMELITAGGRLSVPNGCPPQILPQIVDEEILSWHHQITHTDKATKTAHDSASPRHSFQAPPGHSHHPDHPQHPGHPTNYQIMTVCWATMAEERSRFSEIIELLSGCLSDAIISGQPLPALVHRMNSQNEGGGSAGSGLTTPIDGERSLSLARGGSLSDGSTTLNSGAGSSNNNHNNNNNNSNVTSSTLTNSSYNNNMSGITTTGGDSTTSTTYLPEPMPTKGTGITPSACAPYPKRSSMDTTTNTTTTTNRSSMAGSEDFISNDGVGGYNNNNNNQQQQIEGEELSLMMTGGGPMSSRSGGTTGSSLSDNSNGAGPTDALLPPSQRAPDPPPNQIPFNNINNNSRLLVGGAFQPQHEQQPFGAPNNSNSFQTLSSHQYPPSPPFPSNVGPDPLLHQPHQILPPPRNKHHPQQQQQQQQPHFPPSTSSTNTQSPLAADMITNPHTFTNSTNLSNFQISNQPPAPHGQQNVGIEDDDVFISTTMMTTPEMSSNNFPSSTSASQQPNPKTSRQGVQNSEKSSPYNLMGNLGRMQQSQLL